MATLKEICRDRKVLHKTSYTNRFNCSGLVLLGGKTTFMEGSYRYAQSADLLAITKQATYLSIPEIQCPICFTVYCQLT